MKTSELERVLCFKHERVVSKDNFVRFDQAILQILPGPNRLGYAKATVAIHKSFDRCLGVHFRGRDFPSKLIPLSKFLTPKTLTCRSNPNPLWRRPPASESLST